MLPIIVVNGHKQSALPATDRGLAYGDGLFETMLYTNGAIRLWQYHLSRLQLGLSALNIPLSLERLNDQYVNVTEELATFEQDFVVKLIVTRGDGARGYLAADDIEPTLIAISQPFQVNTEHQQGVRVHICQHRLPDHCAWAGLKTLNQLSYVLASQERTKTSYHEGLLLNVSGHLIEATARNIFLVINGELYTPQLDRSGVAGVMRAFLIDFAKQEGITTHETVLTLDHLSTADEVFLTNSVTGVWPVIECDALRWSIGPITSSINQYVSTFLKQ